MKARIIERITSDGPLPFEQYMAMALYDSEAGYFAQGPLRSVTTGDFLTSPEVSPLFGETLAGFVDAELTRVSGGDVVEIGGGSGSLLRPLAAATGFAERLIAIEASSAARSAILSAVPEALVAASLDDIPGPVRGVAIANEVADNIPVALAVRRGDRWVERWVDVDGAGLGFVEVPARSEVEKWCDVHAGDVVDGGQVEVQIGAAAWLGSLLDHVGSGAVLVIDYGDDAAGLASRRVEGTLRTYEGHHLGPDPLAAPGSTDITVDVAFDALASVARDRGWDLEVLTQRDFLASWGLRQRRDEMRARELELARSGETMERLKMKSRITEADTLMHPRGLGDFRVLVARTPLDSPQGPVPSHP